jgi:hypothetical protein
MNDRTRNIVVPDERTGERILPTAREAEVIDYYAEGYTHRAIESLTGMSSQTQKHMLRRLGIPWASQWTGRGWQTIAWAFPRLMTDAEMLRGSELTDTHLRVSEQRTRDAEREVAATMARAAGQAERAA